METNGLFVTNGSQYIKEKQTPQKWKTIFGYAKNTYGVLKLISTISCPCTFSRYESTWQFYVNYLPRDLSHFDIIL